MKKISLNFISMASLLVIGYSGTAYSQSTDELYKKVFGKFNHEEKKAQIDLTLGEFFIGEVSVTIVDEKIIKISQDDLKIILSNKIREERLPFYQLTEGDIEPGKLPFKINYFPSELRASIEISADDLRPTNAKVYDDLIPYYSKKAIEPAPFSFALNYKLEQSFNSKTNQEDNFLAQTNATMTIQKVSIENQMSYLSNRQSEWGRQATRATFDRPNRRQRYEVGDVNYPIIGYLQGLGLGGVSVYRDFSLNPYRVFSPTSSFEYQVEGRSLVKTFINNVLLKSEYMNTGKYSIQDIPLNDGINKIKVEVTNELGVTKVYTFNDSGSLDLLGEGVSRYAFSTGYPSYEENGSLKYKNDDGPFTTAFYQHGLLRRWTTSAYAQGNSKYKLLGTNQIFTTFFGTMSLDVAGSQNKLNSGYATLATYNLNLFGAYWYDSHTLTTKLEYRSPYFNELGENFQNRYDVIGTVSYTIPLFERINFSLGGSYQNPTLAELARISYNASLTTKIVESSSLTLYAGRTRDDSKKWSDQVFFFFNMTFGKSSTFASAFYEKEAQTKRLTVIRDTGNKYNDLKIAATADNSRSSQTASLDLQYNTVLADVGVREEVVKTKGGGTGNRTSVRLLSAFAFVHNGEDYGYSISRPISNSFVIFKPNHDWRDQEFGVQTSNGTSNTSTGLFGESIVSGLTPYQYRMLQLDPSRLEPGHILGQESFVVYPRKNSGHLFVIGKSGLLVLRGRLMDSKKSPLGLKVGFWTSKVTGKSIPFFTDRDGSFLIEGVDVGVGTLQIDESDVSPLVLDLSGKNHGMVEMGDLALEEGESLQ